MPPITKGAIISTHTRFPCTTNSHFFRFEFSFFTKTRANRFFCKPFYFSYLTFFCNSSLAPHSNSISQKFYFCQAKSTIFFASLSPKRVKERQFLIALIFSPLRELEIKELISFIASFLFASIPLI